MLRNHAVSPLSPKAQDEIIVSLQLCPLKSGMAAFTPKADMCGAARDVRFGPEADMSCSAGDEKIATHD
jgi:hypothetical protein